VPIDERLGIHRRLDAALSRRHVRVARCVAAAVDHDVVEHAVRVAIGGVPLHRAVRRARRGMRERRLHRAHSPSGRVAVATVPSAWKVYVVRCREIAQRRALLRHPVLGIHVCGRLIAWLRDGDEIAASVHGERRHPPARVGDALELAAAVIGEDVCAADGVDERCDPVALRIGLDGRENRLPGAMATRDEAPRRVVTLDERLRRVDDLELAAASPTFASSDAVGSTSTSDLVRDHAVILASSARRRLCVPRVLSCP